MLPVLAMVWAAALPHPPGSASAARVRSSTPVPAQPGMWRQTLRPGIGLLLVNVGYVSILSFGPAATNANGLHIAALIVPLFGAGVIASRTLLAHIPDRLGGARTLPMAAVVEGVALSVVGLASALPLVIGGLDALALGQGLAVPALGLLALGRVPADRQGAAAGAFFAYFDAGVGLGGPAVGAAAGAFNAPVALACAGAAVAAPIPAALPLTGLACWMRPRLP